MSEPKAEGYRSERQAAPYDSDTPMSTSLFPTGTVTFVFTDIEGSTKMLNSLGTYRFHEILEVHTAALRSAFAGDGVEIRFEGDAIFVVFADAAKAVAAVAQAQRNLAAASFPHSTTVRVRVGMHTGVATPGSIQSGADYVGIDVVRAARIRGAAHGGQVLMSDATCVLARPTLPDGVSLRDLGEHRLKDLARPERIHQLVVEGLENDFPPLVSLDRVPNNLPTQLTTFVGREREIEEGVRLLERSRLVTLTGPGGTGKTRLSLQIAAESAERFKDGAFFVPLAPISDPELVPSTIAHTLGVRVSGNEKPLERVAEHVRDKEILLVLDNFEQILPAAPACAELLRAGQRLKLLSSSRAPLRIAGEQEFPIPPLDLPDPKRLPSLEVLAQSDAVRLFVERAKSVKPDFMVTSENAAAVAEICWRLDGLPLAIELAAARVKLLTPQAIAPRLRTGLDLLASTARDVTDRQRTLRGAIAWSYDLLDEGMKRLFERMSVFVAGASLEEIESVCGPADEIGRDVLNGLAELIDHSLVRQVDVAGDPRFRMLVTIRDYALERLEASGEGDKIRDRHCARYLALAERAAPNLQGKEQKRWLDLVELEHDNLRAALEYETTHRGGEEASRFVLALWRFWQTRGHIIEGREWCERVLGMAVLTPTHRLRALEAAGGIAYWQADAEAVHRYYQEAYALAHEIGGPADQAKAAYNLSFTKFVAIDPAERTDVEGGTKLLEEAVAGWRAAGDRAGLGRASWALGSLLQRNNTNPSREQLERAFAYASAALEAHRSLGNRFDQGWDLHLVGLVALKLGRLDESERAWREAYGAFREVGDVSAYPLLTADFAQLALARGEMERHATLVGATHALVRHTGMAAATQFAPAEGFAKPEDIVAPLRPGLERGLAMTVDEAVSYTLGSERA